jgi:carbon storage regulator
MLVLTRRVGQEIVIDGGIRLKIVAVKGKMARLGITAPRSVHVARLELLDKRAKDQQKQCQSTD